VRVWEECIVRGGLCKYVRTRFSLYLDTLQETLLDAVEHRIMLNNSKVLSLTKKLLVGINTGAKHLTCLRAHLAHLLRHLACGCDLSAKPPPTE